MYNTKQKSCHFRVRIFALAPPTGLERRHHPSIFGTIELNFRVRHGNGWTLDVINTNCNVVIISQN